MVALYVTSLDRGSGKTTVCAGLGRHLLSDGKKVGYFKPIITENRISVTEDVDSDTVFMKHLFGLEEPVDLLCPVFSDESSLRDKIEEAYTKVSPDKDVVIVEGVSDWSRASRDVVEALNAKVIVVAGYSKELLKATNGCKDYGEHLLGVVFNKMPRSRLEQTLAEISARFGQAGVNILGILPEDRTLFSLTIGELTEHIQGKTLSRAEKSAELVENFMMGAMPVDSGLEYFGRKDNKVVVVRSERPDMQLAALETSTKCLVLAGNTVPMTVVLRRAEEKAVPIILASDDITTIAANIEAALSKIRFNQENKLPKLIEIMQQHFGFQMVYKGLGLIS